MKIHSFIFSDKPAHRVRRHIAFWTARFFLIFIYSYGVTVFNFLIWGKGGIDGLGECCQVGGIRLLIDMGFCYGVAYWLLPRFLFTRRYVVFGLLLLLLAVFSYAINFVFTMYYYDLFHQPAGAIWRRAWLHAIHFVLGGPPIVCVAFLAIKMMKNWYLKEEEKLLITRENANAELQLLKAQIHPHFLFNTLNNIYSFTLAGHPQATDLADRLSGMMDYMSREGEKEWVPVEKEIQLIQDYMSLEKVRYGDRLDMQVDITGNYEHKLIAPLLMIPFAENCFKHGASIMRGKQWVKLSIEIKDGLLCFDLSNSKPALPPSLPAKKGIGLTNVEKRLQLIYPGEHLLRIESTATSYHVHLEVRLREQWITANNTTLSQYSTETLSYA